MESKTQPEEQKSTFLPITPDNGITKKILTPGYSEEIPQKNQLLILLHTLTSSDGKILQNNIDPEQPTTFYGDSEAYFKGLIISALSMKKGEISEFIISKSEIYGPENSPKEISLNLRIELLDFHDKWKHAIDLDENERYDFALKIKGMGNEHFKNKRYKSAAYFYKMGINYVETLVQEDILVSPVKILDLRKSLYQNLSIVQNNLENWHKTISHCSLILDKDPENGKACYLRAVALSKIGRYDDALKDLKIAQSKSPEDQKIPELIKEILQFMKQQESKEKLKYAKMFAKESIYKEVAPKIKSTLVKFPDYDPANPKVFLEIQVGSRDPRILVFELIKSKVPKTCENFRVFCTGEKVSPYRSYSYKDSYFHKVIKNFMMQGGDIEKRDGTGGYSIYGDKFEDENFFLPHSQAGILSMANQGPDANGCQFFITFKKTPWCNGKNVAFGRLIQGFDFLLNELQSVETATEFYIPKLPIRIINCGEYKKEILVPEMPPKKKKKT